MGMSSPKTKAEARKKIADLQADIARYKAFLASNKGRFSEIDTRNRIASAQAEIAKLKAEIPSLPS